MKKKNKAAQQLGRLAKGVPKNYSPAQLKVLKARLAAARKLRWKNHKKKGVR